MFFIIKPEIYPFDIMVSIDESDDVLSHRLEKMGISEQDSEPLWSMDTASGRCVMFSTNQTVIRLISQENKYEYIKIISHEVFHAVTFVLDRIGMILKVQESDEAYAYFMGFCIKEICKKLKLFN